MIQPLLEGAENVIQRASHCWLVTLSQGRGVDARPMGRVIPTMSRNGWCANFLADSRSKKVRDILSERHVRLIFESGVDAFVSVAGVAEVICDTEVVASRWLPAYDSIFPSAAEKANAVFIDIRAEELRLWIRGLTPEPFGVSSVTLRRPPVGDWQIDSERL
jgi:general stress protein 26